MYILSSIEDLISYHSFHSSAMPVVVLTSMHLVLVVRKGNQLQLQNHNLAVLVRPFYHPHHSLDVLDPRNFHNGHLVAGLNLPHMSRG